MTTGVCPQRFGGDFTCCIIGGPFGGRIVCMAAVFMTAHGPFGGGGAGTACMAMGVHGPFGGGGGTVSMSACCLCQAASAWRTGGGALKPGIGNTTRRWGAKGWRLRRGMAADCWVCEKNR